MSKTIVDFLPAAAGESRSIRRDRDGVDGPGEPGALRPHPVADSTRRGTARPPAKSRASSPVTERSTRAGLDGPGAARRAVARSLGRQSCAVRSTPAETAVFDDAGKARAISFMTSSDPVARASAGSAQADDAILPDGEQGAAGVQSQSRDWRVSDRPRARFRETLLLFARRRVPCDGAAIRAPADLLPRQWVKDERAHLLVGLTTGGTFLIANAPTARALASALGHGSGAHARDGGIFADDTAECRTRGAGVTNWRFRCRGRLPRRAAESAPSGRNRRASHAADAQ